MCIILGNFNLLHIIHQQNGSETTLSIFYAPIYEIMLPSSFPLPLFIPLFLTLIHSSIHPPIPHLFVFLRPSFHLSFFHRFLRSYYYRLSLCHFILIFLFSFLFLLLTLVQFTYEEQHRVTTFEQTKAKPSAVVSAVLLHCRIRLTRIAYVRWSMLSNLHSPQR
jgi:hypothetical protein